MFGELTFIQMLEVVLPKIWDIGTSVASVGFGGFLLYSKFKATPLGTAITNNDFVKEIESFVTGVVNTAENLFPTLNGIKQSAEKKAYAVIETTGFLSKLGVQMTTEEVDTMIESEVGKLHEMQATQPESEDISVNFDAVKKMTGLNSVTREEFIQKVNQFK